MFNRRTLMGTIGFLTLGPMIGSADEPRFDFLRYAEAIDSDVQGTIKLIQAEETSNEVIQPPDVPTQRDPLSSLRETGVRIRRTFDPSDIGKFRQAALPQVAETDLSTPAQVQVNEAVTQRVDTGVSATAPVNVIPASTFALTSQPDVAETLAEVAVAPTVKTQRRSPIAMEPRIRGYHGGQIYTMMDGSYMTPVRPDLDALLTKVDQSLIGSSQVISGPYGLRYGSGFSFINVDTLPTPRYDQLENHLRLGTHVRPNGGQTYNTATLMGGGDVGGYYANVGYRRGSDYEAGNGLDIPSSYDAFNLFSAYGRDLGDHLKMETKFSLLDQGETEYAGQFFDVDSLKHYGLSHSFIYDNDRTGIGFRLDGWISNTDFRGDTDLGGKRRDDFPVLNRVDFALAQNPGLGPIAADPRFSGDVEGELTTTGYRAGLTNGGDDRYSWGAGTDLRYVRQDIDESYDIRDFGFNDADGLFQTGLPQSELIDAGLYVEGTAKLLEPWSVAVGARVGFTNTEADADEVRPESNFRDAGGNLIADLSQNDTLVSYYFNNDFELSQNWTSRIGFGYAERLPDLTDRYSDGLFLAVIQSGFSRVNGNPDLDKERAYQIDVRFDGSYENIRTRLSAFHAWVLDYNTYAANEIGDPSGARLLQAVNTDEATLAGFEGYVEADMTDAWQWFGSIAYVDGRDREISQPLPGISPLESRIGMRLSDTTPKQAWGFETGWRIVDNQDRLASLRSVNNALPPVALETETPGFATAYLRGFYRPNDRWSFTGGIENLFDRNYYEHLSLRLPAEDNIAPDPDFEPTIVLSPGITPYIGVEVEY
ncbi:TonB-dependent receptor [Neorhodopirellula pilleata]|uniref:TonB dependent receptor n=1 Tax=Neorhodopirellula pilleata TaxID=2714738 RepID=A0A5C6APP2_9BACT|nr:TonB-dependent receptor [Neorhodopirellula pilleata]TWU01993.1 TonB dependent receptor [Neorhodopirellula pilleata]